MEIIKIRIEKNGERTFVEKEAEPFVFEGLTYHIAPMVYEKNKYCVVYDGWMFPSTEATKKKTVRDKFEKLMSTDKSYREKAEKAIHHLTWKDDL